MTRVCCPVCDQVMMHRRCDHVGVYDGLDRVLQLDGDTSIDVCQKCGVIVVGFDSVLVPSPD